MLAAVASFEQPDYVMTEAEARALSDSSQVNVPKIPVKSLPTRRRSCRTCSRKMQAMA